MLKVINIINPDRMLQKDLNKDKDNKIFNKICVDTN